MNNFIYTDQIYPFPKWDHMRPTQHENFSDSKRYDQNYLSLYNLKKLNVFSSLRTHKFRRAGTPRIHRTVRWSRQFRSRKSIEAKKFSAIDNRTFRKSHPRIPLKQIIIERSQQHRDLLLFRKAEQVPVRRARERYNPLIKSQQQQSLSGICNSSW